jgi:glycosyltransferase involved in cell wall biosynthesis
MKVLFVTREYPPFEVGGVAVHTFNLVKSLEALGVTCKVLSFGDPNCSTKQVTFIEPHSSIIRKSDSPVYMDFKIPFDILRLTQAANQLLQSSSFDVVHVEEPYVGAFVRHPHKITTVHDTSVGEMQAIFNQKLSLPNLKRVVFYVVFGLFFEFLSAASSTQVIVPASQVKTELRRYYGVSEAKLSIVRNGVVIPQLSGNAHKVFAKQHLGLPPNKPLIFTSAQHIPRKRLDTLILAIKQLQNQGLTDYMVVIGGNGPAHEQLLSLAEKVGLSGVIAFPGWLPRKVLSDYQEAADIFVLTSEYEAGPISLLEAMSWETAAVSSDIEGFPGLMKSGVDGLLFPVDDHLALSGCLKTLLTNTALRGQLEHSARQFAEQFDWNEVAQKTLNIYNAVTGASLSG